MKGKGRINYKVKLFSISLLAMCIILLIWGFMLRELNKYKSSTVRNYSRNQELLVEQVAGNVIQKLESLADEGFTPEEAERIVVDEIITRAETSGSRYWFLYSTSGAVFEKNYEETVNIKGKSPEDLVRYWKIKGGTGIDGFATYLQRRQSGSSVFSKSAGSGDEIVSVKYFTVGEKGYFLGMSTKKDYVWSVGRVSGHILNLYIFAGAVSLAVLVLALLLLMAYLKNHRDNEKSGKEIADKNFYIEELSKKLEQKTETANNASICDVLTKLYNHRFFYTMLARINTGCFQPISIAIADINGLGRLNRSSGYTAGDELLVKTAGLLQKLCMDTDVAARTGRSEFGILMVSTDESQAYGLADNIRRRFDDLVHEGITLSIGVAQMNAGDADIFGVLERARRNMNLEKLNDPASSSYNITAMMMKMLNAYSPQAVSHCNRLKVKAVELGKILGLSGPELTRLAIAAQLHDVGKIGISEAVLNKKEKLTVSEKEMVRKHPEIGYEIVKLIPYLDEVAVDILQHHEYYNGTGYPRGLAGEEITLNARIISVVDSFDAMTNVRSYLTVMTPEEAVSELREKSGIQYDPDIVNAFVKMLEID